MEKINGMNIHLYSQLSITYKSVFDIVLAQESRLKGKYVSMGPLCTGFVCFGVGSDSEF